MITVKWIAALMLAGLLAGCSGQSAPGGEKAAGFELKELEGAVYEVEVKASEGRYNDLLLKGREGKPVLFSFFSTQCPECIVKIPHLIDLQNRYGEKINLIGVLVENKNKDEIADFAAFHGINYPVVLGAGAFKLADAVGGVRLIPALHLYDGGGKYAMHFVGPVPQAMIETRINQLLGETPAP
ncbi:MAG: TlpA family protein disulfide reductase [Campylobacterales bacterium]